MHKWWGISSVALEVSSTCVAGMEVIHRENMAMCLSENKVSMRKVEKEDTY